MMLRRGKTRIRRRRKTISFTSSHNSSLSLFLSILCKITRPIKSISESAASSSDSKGGDEKQKNFARMKRMDEM